MADNVIANEGAGGSTFATDEISNVHYPKSKICWGPAGTANDADVASGKPVPVQIRTSTGVELTFIDDAAYTVGTSPVTPIGGLADDTSPDSVDEGDVGVVRMSLNRNLYMSLRDGAGNERGANVDASNNLNVILAANSGIDIGDVDVLSIIPGTGATNLGKAIDDAGGATDTGVVLLAIRDDTLTTLTPVDGDYVGLRVNSTGALHVTGGTTEYLVNSVVVTDPTGTASLMERDDALSTLSEAAGDWTNQRSNSRGAMWTVHDGTMTVTDDGSFTLAANSGVDIGDVDVLSIVPGTGATNLGKAIDSAAGATDTGVALLAIRDDALTTLTPVDGDYVGLRVNSTGALHVTGGGGGTEYVVNAVAPADPTGTASLMERDDALSTLSEAAGDWTNQRSNSRGAMWTVHDGTMTVTDDGSFTLAANSGVDIGDVDVLSIVPGTGATNLGKAIDSAAGATDTGVALLAIRDDALTTLTPVDGDYVGLRVNSTGALHVTGGGGGTEYVVNAVAPADPTGTASLMERDDALSTLSEAAGDWTNMRSNNRGALWMVHDGTLTVTDDGSFTLAANSGVDIGDVDVTSVVPGTATTSLGKARDDAMGGTDTGIMMLGVRRNELTGSGVADGDYIEIAVANTGALHVTSPPHTSKNGSGTLGGIGQYLSLGDAGAGVINWEIDSGLVGTVVFEATTDGSATWFAVDAMRIDGTIITSTTTFPDRGSFTSYGYGTVRLRVSAYNSGSSAVRIEASAGANVVRLGQGLPANSGVDIGDVDVTSITGVTMSNDSMQTTGDEADDAVDAGNPVKIGGKSKNPWDAGLPEVNANDRVNALFDTNGYFRVRGDFNPKYADINDSTSGNNTIILGAGAGVRIAVWSVMVVSDGTVDVRFEDGIGGTAFTGQIPLQAREGFTYSAGGLVPLWVGSANTLLNLELSAAINVHGHVSYTLMID